LWCVLSPGFRVSYWSSGFATFLQVSVLTSHWPEDYSNITPTQYETTNTATTTLSVIQIASQSIFIHEKLHSTFEVEEDSLKVFFLFEKLFIEVR
jgi:hypothetical protein